MMEGEFRYQRRLLRTGAVAVGRVESATVERARGGPVYTLNYSYAVGDGNSNGVASVTSDVYGTYGQSGRHLTVLYEPRRPKKSRLYATLTAAELAG